MPYYDWESLKREFMLGNFKTLKTIKKTTTARKFSRE